MFNTNHKFTLVHLTVIRGYSCPTFFSVISDWTKIQDFKLGAKFFKLKCCFLPKIGMTGPTESFSVLFIQIISMTQHRSPNTVLQ